MLEIFRYGEDVGDEIFERKNTEKDLSATVHAITEDVRKRGDAAIFEYCKKFDKAELKSLKVSEEEQRQAFEKTEPEFRAVLKRAAENIRDFHSRQLRNGFMTAGPDGIITGQRIIPLDRVGIYVPGGTASYPSTVLMNGIPAKIAGCGEICIVTPPAPDGSINPLVSAAAEIVGIREIYKVGGAQAVAALAYGTESIKKVDKITGPGNAYVAEAKRQLFGKVAIDMIAGPSEILIIADESANAKYIAADLLSQAEHDRNASAVLLCLSAKLALKVREECEKQLEGLSRKETARKSLENNGKIIIVKDRNEAAELANKAAPEHLELCVSEPFALLNKIRHAGSIFLGNFCPEALGDYFAGPNHTLPTSGTARFSSPLSVDDFVKKSQYIYYTKEALAKAHADVECFAEHEGLGAHARSAAVRFEVEDK